MITDNRTVQILLALLRAHGVRHAVLSPGSRNLPITRSLESDPGMRCYSVVDERSAGYFALGLALELGEPVLLSCTSGTAAANYASALWEAAYQRLPLIAVTADRHPYGLGQLEDQMIAQDRMFGAACRESVTLPDVRGDADGIQCRRLVSRALLAAQGPARGPVHINVPIEWGLFPGNFGTTELPDVRPIRRLTTEDLPARSGKDVEGLTDHRRILIVVGQLADADPELRAALAALAERSGAAVVAESTSNLHPGAYINSTLLCRVLRDRDEFERLRPDLVLTIGGNYVSPLKSHLKRWSEVIEHWSISPDGTLRDEFGALTTILQGSPTEVLRSLAAAPWGPPSTGYREEWRRSTAALPEPDLRWSSALVMQRLLRRIPATSRLHLGNGVAVHMAQYFPPVDIYAYAHTGTTTIDGSLSTLIGQAAATQDLCFGFIGDLSAFYDLNALWIRHVPPNLRLLVSNNGGGSTFHWNSARGTPGLERHTSAGHGASIRGWVESLGHHYLAVKDESELDQALDEFTRAPQDRPVVLEVFTDKQEDADVLHDHFEMCRDALRALGLLA